MANVKAWHFKQTVSNTDETGHGRTLIVIRGLLPNREAKCHLYQSNGWMMNTSIAISWIQEYYEFENLEVRPEDDLTREDHTSPYHPMNLRVNRSYIVLLKDVEVKPTYEQMQELLKLMMEEGERERGREGERLIGYDTISLRM